MVEEALGGDCFSAVMVLGVLCRPHGRAIIKCVGNLVDPRKGFLGACVRKRNSRVSQSRAKDCHTEVEIEPCLLLDKEVEKLMADNARLHASAIKNFANCEKCLVGRLLDSLDAQIEVGDEKVHIAAPLKVGVGPEPRAVEHKDRHSVTHLVAQFCCRLVVRIKELGVKSGKLGRQEIARHEPAGWGAKKMESRQVKKSRNGSRQDGEFQLRLCCQ